MRTLGLVPARGGSKAIPGKNLALLGGKPLLAWTIEVALAVEELETVVVSTDDGAIAEAARAAGADVLIRPEHLAADETPMLDVVLHALRTLPGYDALVVLQPTSPFRRAEHVVATLRALEQPGTDTAVTVVEVPHRFLPEQLMLAEDEHLVPVDLDARLRRQDKRTLYARNGPAVLALRTDGLEERGFYGGVVRAVLMDEADSLDVDSPADLERAASALRDRRPA